MKINIKIFFRVFVVSILAINIGCTNDNEVIDETNSKSGIDTAQAFRAFLKKFRPIELPYDYNETSPSKLDLKHNQIDDNDSLFISEQSFICEGFLPDTTNYFCLILLVPADDVYPALYTFNKKGKLIDSKKLDLIGTGGFMCGSSSSAIWKIDKELSVFCTDTVKANDCDSITNFPVKGEVSTLIKTIKGKIQKSGEIEIK